jgi:transposase
MNIKRIGIDLAKQVFQVHGVNGQEKPVLRKQLRRTQMLGFFQKLPPCLIGMEACSIAHYWARELQKLGHIVKLMAPQFVKPYVKSNKNDANDAEAICEAIARPTMRFVAVKTVAQQDIQAVHRIRSELV